MPDPSRRFDAVRRALFAEFARVVVSGGHPIQQLALSHPQALGNIIPEAWAIISEILAVYDVLITRDLFIGSATTRVALQRLADLLGYLPKPSVAAETQVALIGSQSEALTSTLGLTLRASLPSPQVFEPDQVKTLFWNPRTMTIAPVRDTVVSFNEKDDTVKLLLEAATAAPQRNSPVLFLNGYRMRATEILEVKTSQELDGRDYVEIIVTNPKVFNPSLDPHLLGDEVEVQNVSILSPSQRAYVRTDLLGLVTGAIYASGNDLVLSDGPTMSNLEYKPGGYGPAHTGPGPAGALNLGKTLVELDGVYRSIKVADLVIIQKGGYFSPHRVVAAEEKLRHIGAEGTEELDANKPQIPITVITLNPPLNADLGDGLTSAKLIIHYNLHDIGRLMRPAQSELDPAELLARGALDLEGVHRTPSPNPYIGQWLLEDANGRGALVDATMTVDPDRGKATLQITGFTGPAPKLRVPIVAHPNILHVTRGETVKDEALGSGDPTVPSQSFTLKKSPLTYVNAANERGVASTLEVRVDGVLWHEVRTFHGVGPHAHVYIVRQDDDEHSTVTFGDGVRGSRLPAGVRNVRATYRYGAGAAAPPYANLTQIVRGFPGLMRVHSPLAPSGGDDRESARDIRKAAPASALVLGRCVSLPDFSARVANFSGVLNSHVELAWDEAKLAAVVTVWYVPSVPDDAEIAARIVGDLQKLSDPGTIVTATQATPIDLTLVIVIAVAADHVADDVAAAVHAALLDPDTGLLAISNTPLGSGGLSRSALAAAVLAVPGVLDVIRMYDLELDNITEIPPPGLRIPSGEYLDFSGANGTRLYIDATATTQRDCCDLGS